MLRSLPPCNFALTHRRWKEFNDSAALLTRRGQANPRSSIYRWMWRSLGERRATRPDKITAGHSFPSTPYGIWLFSRYHGWHKSPLTLCTNAEDHVVCRSKSVASLETQKNQIRLSRNYRDFMLDVLAYGHISFYLCFSWGFCCCCFGESMVIVYDWE